MSGNMIFPDQDSTNFPIGVKNNLNEILKNSDDKYTKKEFLRYHQYIIYQYMINNPKARGLLLYHEMGMGKSISAVALAEYYRKYDPDRNIVVLLPKSLQENFKKNIGKFIKDQTKNYVKDAAKSPDLASNLTDSQINTIVDKKYKFVSLNASNMFTQMTRIDKTKEELQMEKQLQEFTDIVEKKDFLENSVLIIDEFHNLANSITNGSYNAIRLYDTIMNTKNVKLLFLTGTPIVNNPFELVPTFNMIRGLVPVDSRTSVTLFPELKKDFDMYFVDEKKK
jgi:Rad3-related DNA helicase